jgi:plasmid stability protein
MRGMAVPTTLSIKNVRDDVAQLLRERAARHHRSLQGELLAIIEAAVVDEVTVENLYARVQKLDLGADGDSTAFIRQDRDSR